MTLVHTHTHTHTRHDSARFFSLPLNLARALDAVVHIGVHIQLFFFLSSLLLLLSFWCFFCCCWWWCFAALMRPSPCILDFVLFLPLPRLPALCSLNMYYTCVCVCVLLLHAQIYCRVVASMFVWCEMMLMVIT